MSMDLPEIVQSAGRPPDYMSLPHLFAREAAFFVAGAEGGTGNPTGRAAVNAGCYCSSGLIEYEYEYE